MSVLIPDAALAVAIAALVVAFWQLYLQRRDIQRNGEIAFMLHLVTMLKDKIEYHERIIADIKERKRGDWSGYAHLVNKTLAPLRRRVESSLIGTFGSRPNRVIDIEEVFDALKLDGR